MMLCVGVLFMCCIFMAWVYYHLNYMKVLLPDVEGAITLESLLKCSKTGDIIMFCGTSRDSSVVKGWSGCRWSHIGIIVEDEKTFEKYLYNADACTSLRNVTNGSYDEGVQLNDLEVCIKSYQGYVYYAPLMNIYGKECQFSDLLPMMRLLNGCKFNHDWSELLRCTFGKGGGYLGSKIEHVDSFFCSQLVAHAYYRMGVIGNDIPFNEYHPSSFIGELQADWINGYYAGELFLVRLSNCK